MGNPLSKNTEIENKPSEEGTSPPTTPVLKTKFSLQDLDPRSPSSNITRTPMQTLTNIDLNSTVTLECISTPSTKKLPADYQLCVDPRSPTNEYVRTPIVNVSPKEMSKIGIMKLHNKNLDNVRKLIIQDASFDKKCDSKPTVVPPRLLESSPAKRKPNNYKRRSFAGLLETNIDYVETDLDAVIAKNNSPLKVEKRYSTPINKLREQFLNGENKISVECLENADPRSPTTDFLRTPIQISKKIGEIELNNVESESRISESDTECQKPEENITDIVEKEFIAVPEELTSTPVEQITVLKKQDVTEEEEKEKAVSTPLHERPADLTSSEENKNIEVVTPTTADEELSSAIVDSIGQNQKKQEVKSITKNLKEFDKKLSNLIYEDVEIVLPQIRRVKEGHRTPLGTRNENSIKTSRLRVSDKPTKNGGNSKIPVFKEKLIKGKLEPCENTPPRLNKSKWDTDRSLII